MTARALVVALVALIAAGLCARMGLWQLARYRAKHRQNLEVRAALSAPALAWSNGAAPGGEGPVRRLEVRGTFDESRHLLLSDVWRDEVAGVELLTALRLADGSAVIVDRGWLPSPDAIHADVASAAEPGERVVVGLPAATGPSPGGPAWERLPDSTATLWSARRFDPDSARARWPYPLAAGVLRALPDSAAPTGPLRSLPLAANEGMHLSYAVQWFLFAFFTLAGAVFVAHRERARRAGIARDA